MSIEIPFTELGLILVTLGFILLFIAIIYSSKQGGDYGGLVLIGPIPIVFGSWKFLRRFWWILSLIGIILLILFLLPLLYLFQDFSPNMVIYKWIT